MHSMAHRTASLVLVLVVVALASQLFLHRGLGKRLPCLQIYSICFHKGLGHLKDVGYQSIKQISRHRLADDDTKNFNFVFPGRERVV